MVNEGVENEEIQLLKKPNEQADFNKEVKNEDALYKFLAYSGMLEKKRREDLNKTRKNNEISFGLENFEEFYKGELQRDAKKDPRPVNAADYLPKRGAPANPAEGFKNTKEREADYFREFELYKENKSEYSLLVPFDKTGGEIFIIQIMDNFLLLFRGANREKPALLRARAVLRPLQGKPRPSQQSSGSYHRLLQRHREHFLLRQEQDPVRTHCSV